MKKTIDPLFFFIGLVMAILVITHLQGDWCMPWQEQVMIRYGSISIGPTYVCQ